MRLHHTPWLRKTERELLEEELELEREIRRRMDQRPLDHMSWLPGQLAFLACEDKRKLFRAGSQSSGKTTVGAAETVYFGEGYSPFRRVPPPPTLQWVLSPTERASGIAQERVWNLLDRSQLATDSPVYDESKGAISGKYPKYMWRNGSRVEFRWGAGDLLNLASATVHRIWIDEPPESERVFNELQKRLLRTNGWLAGTLTPVNRPVAYLKKRVAEKKIRDLHFRLTPENMVFVHGPETGKRIRLEDGTPCDEDWIRGLIHETSDMEVPVTVHGEFEFRLEGAYFEKVWNATQMVADEPPDVAMEAVIGIDFGDRPGKFVAHLMFVDEVNQGTGRPFVYVADSYVATTGRETIEDHAKAILKMLRKHRWKWHELKYVLSDRDHKAGRADVISAWKLQAAIAAELGLDPRALSPQILIAKRGEGRGDGSVGTRSGWLHEQMAHGNFAVDKRCERLIEAIPKYSPFRPDEEWKDQIDAVVYGLDRYTYADRRRLRIAAR